MTRERVRAVAREVMIEDCNAARQAAAKLVPVSLPTDSEHQFTSPKLPKLEAKVHRELESHLEAYFRDKVRKAGGSVHKLVGEAGIPDRMVLLPGGKIYLVELKIPSGRVSEIQKVWHFKASQKGVFVDVVWGRAGVDKWMEARAA